MCVPSSSSVSSCSPIVRVFSRNIAEDKKVVCYFSSWSKYRPGDGAFHIDEADPFLCTHIVYTFAGLDLHGNIASLDPDNDVRDSEHHEP